MKQSDELYLIVNGRELWVDAKFATYSLSQYLREELFLTGTKIVCSEGDCGACSVLVLFPQEQNPTFKPINSCVSYLFSLIGAHILTVESFKSEGDLSEIQQAMVDCNGSQCGFCTPGFVTALAGVVEEKGSSLSETQVRNALTGNLCRCTGYKAIINAGCAVSNTPAGSLFDRYQSDKIQQNQKNELKKSRRFSNGHSDIFVPVGLDELLSLKSQYPKARLYSGGTDLGVLLNKQKIKLQQVISLNGIAEFYEQSFQDGTLRMGAKTTFSEVQRLLEENIPEMADLIHIFASPQIKNVGTIIGNIANGSPIGDTLPFLFIMQAQLEIKSCKGTRRLPITEFYKAYKEFDLQVDEIITSVDFKIEPESFYRFYKASQRRDLDISSVSLAGRMFRDQKGTQKIHLAVGGVAGTVIRLLKTEARLESCGWSTQEVNLATEIAESEFTALSDVRGSAEFRTLLVKNMIHKFAGEVQAQGIK